MRGGAEGRGEPEYLHSKYSEMPTFLRKVGTPSDLASLGHLPHEWGRQALFFDTLRKGVPIRHALVDYTIHFPINGMRRSSAARVREMANTAADSTGTLQTGSQVST